MSDVFGLFSLTFMVFTLLLFLRAAAHKLFEFDEFTGFLTDYELIPEQLIEHAAKGIVSLELLTVFTLLFPATRWFGLLLAATLLGIYAGAIVINLKRGNRRIECGCGGAPQLLSASLVWRNIILIAMALVPLSGLPEQVTAAEVSLSIIAAVCLWVLYALFEQTNANLIAIKARHY